MKLLIIRHGATEWSVTGQHTGTTDIPLTEDGLNQAHLAREAALRLVGEELATALVYTSPLQRARRTADIVMARPSDEFTVTDLLLEYNYGDYEGLTPTQIRSLHPGWDIWRDGCPGGESTDGVGRRANAFLREVERNDRLVVAFAHGHIIRILGACAVGLTARHGQIFTLDTATLSMIEDVRSKRVVKVWNLDPRLIQ